MKSTPQRVLLVEDNPTDAHLVHAFFEREESEFGAPEQATTLAEALRALRTNEFDLVLLDLILPDARDLEALEAIRSEAPQVPIVVFTIREDEALGREAVHRGAQDYLMKPRISPEVLFRSLRYALERHRRQVAEEALWRAQKMDAVGQLAGGVAHEFNNLLLAIQGNAEIVLMELPASSPMRDDLVEIQHATERAARLTRQLLAFGRKQPLQPEVLDLNELIFGMDSLMRPALGERIEMVDRLDPELGRIRADRASLEQVVMNLALNARDAMPGGGTLTIATRNTSAQESTESDAPEMVELVMADTGVGMDQDTVDRIFEPFFTTKKQDLGVGLGLSAVHGIVQQSGGRVDVKSARGEGTTVTVHLPRLEGREAPTTTLEETREVGSPGVASGTILVVDDDHAVRQVASRILRRGGYQTVEAANSTEAISMAAAFEGTIHLLLTDVVMPGQSGPELAEELSDARPDMKVVFMSGYTREQLPMSPDASARHVLLEKPFSGSELLRAVEHALSSGPDTVEPTRMRE